MSTARQRYEQACRTPSDIVEHLPTMHDLAVQLDAQQIIELGVRGGVSSWAWLAAVEETDGLVWGVDLDPAPAEVAAHDRYTFVQGDDLSVELIEHSLPEDVDIVFIDTDHTYELTTGELAAYHDRVRPGGLIVLHDTAVREFPHHRLEGRPPQPAYPVAAAVREFLTLDRAADGWACEWLPNCNGLAVIMRP